MDKVQGGTPRDTTSLCATCRYALNVRGTNFEEVAICRAVQPNQPMRFTVERCNGYDDRRVPSQWDMEKIAWVVHSRNRGPIGFAGQAHEIMIDPPSPSYIRPTQEGSPLK